MSDPIPPAGSDAQTQEGVSIRAGGFYRNAKGEKVGPMYRIAGDAAQIWYAVSHRGDWSNDGRALHAEPTENLVAECPADAASRLPAPSEEASIYAGLARAHTTPYAPKNQADAQTQEGRE